MVIPPFIFYAIGATLIVFGAWRAYQLGFRGGRGDVDEVQSAARAKSRKRHTAMGLIWVAMGGYVVWTAVALQRQQSGVSEIDGAAVGVDQAAGRAERLRAPSVRFVRAEPVSPDAGS